MCILTVLLTAGKIWQRHYHRGLDIRPVPDSDTRGGGEGNRGGEESKVGADDVTRVNTTVVVKSREFFLSFFLRLLSPEILEWV